MKAIDGIYYVIKDKKSGSTLSPPGVSSAPHLYASKGKAEGRRKALGYSADYYEVVPVHLTELKQGVQA